MNLYGETPITQYSPRRLGPLCPDQTLELPVVTSITFFNNPQTRNNIHRQSINFDL